MSEEPRFGKYTVVRRVGLGSMAEALLCRLTGLGGIELMVVIKRVLPDHRSKKEFVETFLAEQRLAAQLGHSNIAQVYEVGQIDDAPYVSTEYVRGPTLAALIAQAQRRGRLHIGHAVKLVSGMCAGLYYAHHSMDATGERLKIVHRAVCPQNVVVAAEGVPKLLDFGVAKARTKIHLNDAAELRARLRFSAPELVRGEAVDRRADIFSAAACLYEATTGHPVYMARSDSELLGAAMRGEVVRPSEVVRGYPSDLEGVLLWALDPDPAKRCRSALELRDALDGFVRGGKYQSNSIAIARWIEELFPQATNPSPSQTEDLYVPIPAPPPIEMPVPPAMVRKGASARGVAPAAEEAPKPVGPSAATAVPPPPPPEALVELCVSDELAEPSSPQLVVPPPPRVEPLIELPVPPPPPAEALAEASASPAIPVVPVASPQIEVAHPVSARPPEPLAPRPGERRRALFIQFAIIAMAALAGALAMRVPWPGTDSAAKAPARPAPLATVVPPMTEADKLLKSYLDVAEQTMREKRFGAARDVLKQARDLKATDKTLLLRLARVSDENERAGAIHEARVAIRSNEPKAALEAATRAYLRAPDDQDAQRLLELAKMQLVASGQPLPSEIPSDTKLGGAETDEKDEPAKVEPAKIAEKEPKKSRTVMTLDRVTFDSDAQEGTGTVEPAKAEVGKAQPPNPEPAKVEPPKPEPPKPEPAEPVANAATEPGEIAKPVIAPGRPPAPPKDPRTHLPVSYRVKSPDELARICLNIEGEVVSAAAISADIVSGITGELQAELGKFFGKYKAVEFYPQGIYLLIVSEASKGKDRGSIGRKVRDAHSQGTFRAWAGR